MSDPTRTPYTYVVLRYRHDTLAGEFANVGVVLHAPAPGFLAASMRHTIGRLARMFPDLNADALKGSVRSIERAIERLATQEGGDLFARSKHAGTFARAILPQDDSSFIWGPVGSGLTADPAGTLDKLYDRFVALYDEPPRQHRDDAAVWKPVRDRLAERNLVDRLQAKMIRSSVDYVEFENAWKNGAWHCYQPLSFDLANDENIRDKARRWAGHLLALHDASEPFRACFFVGPPADENLRSAYEAAVSILKLGPGEPQVIDEAHADDLVRQIEEGIRAHDQEAAS